MSMGEPEFNRGAVRPMVCLREGWQLIKERYWLFLGITFVGVLVASAAPMALLMGPALCGIYLCLLRHGRGREVSFETLFQGFNFFGPGLVASLIMVLPTIVIMLVFYVAFFVALFVLMPQGGGANQQVPWILFVLIGVFVLAIMFFSVLVNALFLFAFPLIADRNLSGWDAVRLSVRAGLGNFGGVLGLVLLQMLLGFLGALACYIGAIFVLPISFAASAIAYEQVFGTDEWPERLDEDSDRHEKEPLD